MFIHPPSTLPDAGRAEVRALPTRAVQPLWTISERQGGHSARARICHARAVRAEFIDSTGLRCILDLDAESLQDGFSIALIQGPLPRSPHLRAHQIPTRCFASSSPENRSRDARRWDRGGSRTRPGGDRRIARAITLRTGADEGSRLLVSVLVTTASAMPKSPPTRRCSSPRRSTPTRLRIEVSNAGTADGTVGRRPPRFSDGAGRSESTWSPSSSAHGASSAGRKVRPCGSSSGARPR